MAVTYVSQCKVCNSKYRNLIEDLHIKGMSPQKIYDYLQSLTDPAEKELVIQEDIKPSAIRRHMDRHFDIQDGAKIKIAETQQRIEQSRDSYKQGVSIVIDKVNSISHLIETAMIKVEEVEQLNNPTKQHQLTIQYMNTIKGLIESLAKLTGDLKQEGTIDINFFSNEIAKFAEIVLITIREIDTQMGLNHQLEYSFGNEFKKQWDSYVTVQQKKIIGEIPVGEYDKTMNVNTFNELG